MDGTIVDLFLFVALFLFLFLILFLLLSLSLSLFLFLLKELDAKAEPLTFGLFRGVPAPAIPAPVLSMLHKYFFLRLRFFAINNFIVLTATHFHDLRRFFLEKLREKE